MTRVVVSIFLAAFATVATANTDIPSARTSPGADREDQCRVAVAHYYTSPATSGAILLAYPWCFPKPQEVSNPAPAPGAAY